jgi:UDP-N-acetylmuramate--alanine ligase
MNGVMLDAGGTLTQMTLNKMNRNQFGGGMESTEYDSDQNHLPVICPGLRIHFIGIGGIGMSGLARICLHQGATLSGADERDNLQTRYLSDHGANILIGEHPELLENCDLVVYSSAVSETHPERLRAEQLQIPTIRRGTLLAHLTRDLRLLGVAGTHGKTTTTGMLAFALRATGLDPTILIGGDLPAIGGNSHPGKDHWCVAETDESDGSFLELNPHLVLVTNVEDDHLEHYGDVYALQDAFRDYISTVKDPSLRILCADCAHLYTLARRSFNLNFVSYGFSDLCDVQGVDLQLDSRGSSCAIMQYGVFVGRLKIQVPGVHMLSNALGALSAGMSLGFPTKELLQGLSEYSGTRRRFEILGNWRGATLVDDYGHHPTEIQVTLRALHQYTEGRCVVVFQPHRYSRTDQLFDEFGDSFGGIDILILSEIYSAGEKPRPGVTSKHLLSRIRGVERVLYASTLLDVEKTLRNQLEEGDTVLFLGAGDINQVAYKLLQDE